jgi:molybdate/tungstate transport system permease protein
MVRLRQLCARLLMLAFTLALLYPLTGLDAPVGPWRWGGGYPGSTASAVKVSLVLTALALLLVVIAGTPAAYYLARREGVERAIWEGALLVSVLLPPLALGILLSLSFSPVTRLGGWLTRLGVASTNSATAFVATQFYVSAGYYVIAARAAFAAVPRELEQAAGLLGLPPLRVFWRVTFPLARLGLAAAASLAWARALGEFGAVVITAYYPSGMPVQIWINLQETGLSAVMPLLLIFLLSALPLPWLIHLAARRSPVHV